MTYLPHTDKDRAAMLGTIGADSLEALFKNIPAHLRFPQLDLPAPLSELELQQEMSALAAGNICTSHGRCFLGAGAYQHYIPATVDEVLRNSEFYSAYTPYQPEASQGMLQAMFEYQTMICRLTAMDVSNASHYDGATALAEAVLVALSATPDDRNEVILSPHLNPQYVSVLHTYLGGTEATLRTHSDLNQGSDKLKDLLNQNTAAVVLQNPDFFGQFEDVEDLATAVHEAGALFVVVPDPVSLGLFNPPGHYGADLVAADGQSLGIPLSFGGPHLGIFAATQNLMRRSVGRLVGETVDSQGKRGYVLTLSTREQHIRREKATSNICTNSALTALAATVYMATLGKSGFNQLARLCYHRSHYAAHKISLIQGCSVNPHAPERPHFKEFMVKLPCSVKSLNEYLLEEHEIIGGYDLGADFPELEQHVLLAFTELTSKIHIDQLAAGIAAYLKQ